MYKCIFPSELWVWVERIELAASQLQQLHLHAHFEGFTLTDPPLQAGGSVRVYKERGGEFKHEYKSYL